MANELKNQQKGKFPSDTEQNPRDHCKAITPISGKEVESSRQRKENGKEDEVKREIEIEPEEVKPTEAPKPRGILFPDNPPIISPYCAFHRDFRRRRLKPSSPSFLRFSRKSTSTFLLSMLWNKCPTMPSL